MSEFLKLVDICKGHNVVIQTHNFPDADAVSSSFALQELLKQYGIDSILCSVGDIDRVSTSKMLDLFNIEMNEYDSVKSSLKETDYVICVDSQKNAGNIADIVGDEIACIDHHPTFVEVEYKYKEVEITGACASLLARHYKELGITPGESVATALLYGIKMDTLQFTRGVTMLDIQMFEFLFPLINQEKLTTLEINNMEFRDLKSYGTAIQNIEVYKKVGFAQIPFFCPDGLMGIISDFILAIEEVDVAVVFSDRNGGYKFSVRSEIQSIHAGNLIKQALDGIGNGGGHAAMAGGFVPKENADKLQGDIEDIIQERIMKCIGVMQQ